jgi:hypothetical protein
MASNDHPLSKKVVPGLLACDALTVVITATAAIVSGFEIIGRTVPFAYPCRLTETHAMARPTAWGFYNVDNLIARIIYLARCEKPNYGNVLRMKSNASLCWITGSSGPFILLSSASLATLGFSRGEKYRSNHDIR